MSTPWGEMPIILDADSGIAALEREQMTKLRPMEVEGPAIHQPSSSDSSRTSGSYPAEDFAVDPLTLHNIKLVQFSKKLRNMIQNANQQLDVWKSGEAEREKEKTDVKFQPEFPAAPPIPEYPGPDVKQTGQCKALAYTSKDPDSMFAQGIGSAPLELDSRMCRKLMRRSAAAICAHVGFDNCSEMILESLTDVSHEYMLQMTKLLRVAVDNEAIVGGTGFPDAVEQVFHEMGIGSPSVLHQFYQTSMLQYHKNLLSTCHQLVQEYDTVSHPDLRPPEELPSIVKKEETIAAIHFPAQEDADEGNDMDVMNLQGLGLDINIVNEPSSTLTTEEELGRWSSKADTAEKSVSLDHFEQKDSPGGREDSSSPVMGGNSSEAGDSLQDPGSVSVSDIMSPPSIGIRASTKPPPAKKKRM